jgi:hypothetical protein
LRLEPIQELDVLDTLHHGNVKVIGHLFDQTPADLIGALVTERGIFNPKDCATLMGKMPLSGKLSGKLHAWAYQNSHESLARKD